MTEEDKIPLPFIYYLLTNKKGYQHIPSDIAGKSCLCVCERGGKWCVCKIKLSLHAYHLASKLLSRDRLNGHNRNSLILVSCCILIPASILYPAPLPVYLFNQFAVCVCVLCSWSRPPAFQSKAALTSTSVRSRLSFNLFITSFLFTQTAHLCSLSPHPHSPQDKSHVLPSHTRLPGKISSQDMKGEERVEILSLRTLPSRLP